MRKDRGAGAQEIRGPMGYGTRVWKGWEEGVLKARKKNRGIYAKMLNIPQPKKG